MQKQIQSRRSKRPNTVSFPADIKENDDVAVKDVDIDINIDQFSFEYIRSFFREQCEEEMVKIGRNASFQSESPGYIFPPRRGAPVSADSGATAIGEELSSFATPAPTAVEVEEESDVVVVVTYSRSPSEDFRRSMMEIMAARVECEGDVDREFMEDLLLRYLEINNEKFYRHILQAFLELIGVSYEDSGKTPPRRRRWSGGFSRRKLKLEIKNMHKFCRVAQNLVKKAKAKTMGKNLKEEKL